MSLSVTEFDPRVGGQLVPALGVVSVTHVSEMGLCVQTLCLYSWNWKRGFMVIQSESSGYINKMKGNGILLIDNS